MEEDIRKICGSVAFSLAKFLMVVFSTRELDFYKNFHDKKHLHYTSTCSQKHKSVSLTFNRQSVSVIMYPGVFFALVCIFVFVSLSCSKILGENSGINNDRFNNGMIKNDHLSFFTFPLFLRRLVQGR